MAIQKTMSFHEELLRDAFQLTMADYIDHLEEQDVSVSESGNGVLSGSHVDVIFTKDVKPALLSAFANSVKDMTGQAVSTPNAKTVRIHSGVEKIIAPFDMGTFQRHMKCNAP